MADLNNYYVVRLKNGKSSKALPSFTDACSWAEENYEGVGTVKIEQHQRNLAKQIENARADIKRLEMSLSLRNSELNELSRHLNGSSLKPSDEA